MNTEITLDKLIDDFIKFKRAIGYSYDTEAYYLGQFRFVCEKRGCLNVPGKPEFMEWLARRPEELPQTQHTRLSPIRQLYTYIRDVVDGVSFVLPKSVKAASEKYKPHFLREEEISRFFGACDSLKVRTENPCREVILSSP